MVQRISSTTLYLVVAGLAVIAGGPSGMMVCLGADDHVAIEMLEVHRCCAHGEAPHGHLPLSPEAAAQADSCLEGCGGCTDIPLSGAGVVLVQQSSVKVPIPVATLMQSVHDVAPWQGPLMHAGGTAFWSDDGALVLLCCTILLI